MPITVNLAPKTCRNGHVKTSANTYTSTSGHERCRDCRRKHKPLTVRACPACQQPFSGSGQGRCPTCIAAAKRTEILEETPSLARTRVCQGCHESQPLDQFLFATHGSARKGGQQYSHLCEDCREDGEGAASSPYEQAKQQLVRVFRVPAKEWISRPGHVLYDLHYLRMLAIQHSTARATGQRPVRPELDTRSRLLWGRLREFMHQPGGVSTTFSLSRAA
jgi:hypothetical protein